MRSSPRLDSECARPRPLGRRAGLRACLATACLVALAAPAGAAGLTRLRVTIESTLGEPLRGELAVAGGTLEKLQPLSLSPDAAAGLSLVEGKVLLHAATPHRRDAFDVTARAEPGARLELRLAGVAEEVAAVDLDTARRSSPSAPATAVAGPSGVAVSVSRMPNDRLRIVTGRDSLVFAPGEGFAFDVLADPLGIAEGEPYELRAAVAAGRTGPEKWRSAAQRLRASEAAPSSAHFEVPLPADEGVYRLRIVATKPGGLRSRILPNSPLLHAGEEPLAERTFQVAVHDPERRPPSPGGWRETLSFDPRQKGWADRIPERIRWARLPWQAAGARASSPGPEVVRDGAVEIAPGGGAATAPWRAYPLTIDEPGALYAIEVEALGAPGDALTVAVFEPDAVGEVRPNGAAVTAVRPRWNLDDDPPPARLVVRPRTAAPLLVIANPSPTAAARFGRIRLLKSEGAPAAINPGVRLVAIDCADADLPHATGASHVLSDLGAFEQADLVTFWETAMILADRVEASGANGAAVAVNQAGAAIFPSQLWGSPRFDLGVWSDGTADLPRRELLALVAREFGRRELRLVPVLRFDAPTAVVERAGGVYTPDGDAAVVARRLAADELLDAVGASAALAGVGVRFGADCWAMYGEIRGAGDQGPARLASAYGDLGRVLAERSPPTRLLLLPAELTRRGDLGRALAPRLAGGNAAASEAFASVGLNEIAKLSPLVEMAVPHGATGRRLRGGPAAEDTLHNAFRRGAAEPWSGRAVSVASGIEGLGLAEPARLRGGANGSELVIPTVVADADALDKVLASVAATPCETILLGGYAPAGWVDERSATLRRRLASLPLPAVPVAGADPSADEARDVIASSFDTTGDGRVALLTNRTPWPQRALVTLRASGRVRGERLDGAGSDGAAAPRERWFEAGTHALDVTLEPFASAAWRFSSPLVTTEGVQVASNPPAQRELAAALADLQSRDTTQRRPFEAIANPSFESAGEGGSPGAALATWAVSGDAVRDPAVSIDGIASARLTATAASPAALESAPFPAPPTGQLVLSLRARPGKLSPDVTLHVDLEQIGGLYRNRATLSADQLRVIDPADGGWLPPIVFPSDDLPLDEGASMRLRLTLTGDGEVWVDDLRPEDLLLPLDGHGAIDLRSERFAVVRLLQTSQKLLDEGRLEACRETLDSYWARFLVTHFPLREAGESVAEGASPPGDATAAEPEAQDTTPSLGERVRGYLPRWWR